MRIQRKDGSVYYATPVQADGAGFPDTLLLRGRVLLVWELKVPPNKLTPEQGEWLEAFIAIGADARVLTPDDWPYIERVLTARECGDNP